MVAQFLGLRLRSLANIFRRTRAQNVGLVIAVLLAVSVAAGVIWEFITLSGASIGFASEMVVTVGGIVVFGFLAVPVFFGGARSLDPRAFALFGFRPTALSGLIVLSSMLGLPAILAGVIAVSQVVLWSRFSGGLFLSLIGVPTIIVTCILCSRVSASFATMLIVSRRAREVTTLVGLAIVVCLAPLIAVSATVRTTPHVRQLFATGAAILGWTPFGAIWSAPAEAASGHPGTAIAKLAIALVFALLLWFAWRAIVGALLVTGFSALSGGHARTYEHEDAPLELGWFAWMPATPAGAVAARSLTYWLRDSRYRLALVAVPVAPLIFLSVLAVAGVPLHALALIPVPAMALFLSWSIHNDVALDNSAIWLHISADISGRADRAGRIVPALLIGILLIGIGSPISASLSGDISVLPSIIGVSSSMLLSGLGLSSIVSARFPYPSVRPGDSPFAQPQTSGTSAGLIQGISLGATILASGPAVVFAILGLVFGGPWPLVSLLIGIGLGMLVLQAGIVRGGTVFGRRAPEILAFTLRN